MNTSDTRKDVRNALAGLRAVRDGHLYQPHSVRFKLAEAKRLEARLEKWAMALWNLRREAEAAFCEGWPKAKDAPWMID